MVQAYFFPAALVFFFSFLHLLAIALLSHPGPPESLTDIIPVSVPAPFLLPPLGA
jgi:hypothetical protein